MLLEECANLVAREARVEAHRLSRRSEGRRQALAVLVQAARAVAGTGPAVLLEREREQRTRLLLDGRLADLVYVPHLAEQEVAPFYAMQREVTNEEYAAFVAAGGYATPSLFDPEARPRLASYRDGTPSGDRMMSTGVPSARNGMSSSGRILAITPLLP